VSWAIDEKRYSQRRACALVGLHPLGYRYAWTRSDDTALRAKLRELAARQTTSRPVPRVMVDRPTNMCFTRSVAQLDRLSRKLIRSIYEEGGSVGEAVGGHSFGQCELLWDVGGRALAGSKGSHGRDRRSFKDLSYPVFALFEPALDLPSF
jgi:hypothetical protein